MSYVLRSEKKLRTCSIYIVLSADPVFIFNSSSYVDPSQVRASRLSNPVLPFAASLQFNWPATTPAFDLQPYSVCIPRETSQVPEPNLLSGSDEFMVPYLQCEIFSFLNLFASLPSYWVCLSRIDVVWVCVCNIPEFYLSLAMAELCYCLPYDLLGNMHVRCNGKK